MKIYFCRWPNGDLSIAAGRSLEEIDSVLDEVGDGHAAELIPVKGRFAVHFRLNEKAEDVQGMTHLLELTCFDEASDQRLAEAYPLLRDAFRLACAVDLGESDASPDEVQEVIEAAITAELKREMDPEKCKVLDGHCCFHGGGVVSDALKAQFDHDAPQREESR